MAFTLLNPVNVVSFMVEEYSWSESDLSGSVREYMIYFTGLGEGRSLSVDLEELLEKLPYRESEVMDDLGRLEDTGYIESNHSGIYPLETKGFDERLEETVFESVEETSYRLGEKGLEFLSEAGLKDYEESLREIFR